MFKKLFYFLYYRDTKVITKMYPDFIATRDPNFEYINTGHQEIIMSYFTPVYAYEIKWNKQTNWTIIIRQNNYTVSVYNKKYYKLHDDIKYIIDFFCWLSDVEGREHIRRTALGQAAKDVSIMSFAMKKIKEIEANIASKMVEKTEIY